MVTNGRVAMITGAGTGIGRCSALALLKDEYSVVLAGRRLEYLQGTAEAAGNFSLHAIPVSTDVRDPRSVKALFAKTYETLGHLDVLFNNTGIGAPSVPFSDITYT